MVGSTYCDERGNTLNNPKTTKLRAGQSLVEFALMIPLIFILIVNIVNFAGFFSAFINVGNASRSAGDYTIMGSISYSGTDVSGNAGPPLSAPSDNGSSGAQLVANMLGTDMLSLKNRSSILVRVCRLNPSSAAIANATCNVCNNTAGTGTMSCTSGSGSFTSNPSPDTSTGEGTNYTLTWVDVSYTYNPFIPVGFAFPGLGFGVTLPSNLVVHRQSVYRVLN
jgi:Flp pilus assembly protein TadG